MKLSDYTEDIDIKESVEYIFNCFQNVFPKTRYDERETIIGIGEEGRHLFCYFKIEADGSKSVKFKSDSEAVDVLSSKRIINKRIRDTIDLFSKNEYKSVNKRIQVVNEKIEEINIVEFDKEEKKYRERLNAVPEAYNSCDVETLFSKRIKTVFLKNDIKTIEDLRKFSVSALLNLRGFGFKSYDELLDVFSKLIKGKLPKQVSENKPNNLGCLYVKPTNKAIRKWENKTEITEYLTSIAYNEELFEHKTLGRVLCLRHKLPDFSIFSLSNDAEYIKKNYFNNQELYGKYCDKLKSFIYDMLSANLSPDRNLPMISMVLGLFDSPRTLQEAGEVYELSRERVNQIFKKSLTKRYKIFSNKTEEGLLRKVEQFNILNELSSIGIESFLLYIRLNCIKRFYQATRTLLLDGITVSENFFDVINIVAKELEGKKSRKTTKVESSKGMLYKGFTLIVDENGEILTDIDLLEKLREKRNEIAKKDKVSPFVVFHNKQLVALSTFKPSCKEMYVALAGFTSKSWNKYGYIMVDIIKEYKGS